MKQWLLRHSRAGVKGLVAGGIVGAVLAAGVAYAATGDHTSSTSGPIQGCVLPGGILRVIEPPQHCRRFEKPISLGGVGAPGPSTPSVLTGRINDPAPGDHYWGAVSGVSTGTEDADANQTLSPASTRTAQNLSVHLGAPAAGSPVIVVVEIGGQPGPECQVMPGQSTCTDTTTHAPVPPGSVLDVGVYTDSQHAPTSVAFGFELA